METILILSALAALLFSGLLVASMLGRARRPELRMSREVDLIDEADGEDSLIRSLEPAPASPIDRSATTLEIEPGAGAPPHLPAPDLPAPDRDGRRPDGGAH